MSIPTVRIPIKVFHPKAHVPKYQTRGAAGMDLHSVDELWVAPGERRLFRTGIGFAIPEGREGHVRPRSGLARRDGIVAIHGTIDSDYRGEVHVLLHNIGREGFFVVEGMRIAQIVFSTVERAELAVVDELDSTERGANGFGSTGI